MTKFFIEGGWGMWPVLIVGLIHLFAAVRYLIDGEPIRLRFLTVLVLAQLALIAQTCTGNVSTVFFHMRDAKSIPDELFSRFLVAGFMESTRPALLGLGMLSLALILISIGVYRVGQRELRAARGS